MADRKAILVLGMHRSGTSVVAKTLNLLGASLPRPSLADRLRTPVGPFEPYGLVETHDRLLESAGTRWTDWSRMPASWYESPCRDLFVDEIARGLRDSYGESPLFVVKDPRIARFVPVWLDVLSRLGIEPIAVIPYRNPLEVARSLVARDRTTLGHGLLSWLRHCLDAEAETRGLRRHFVSYEGLVGDSQMTVYRLMEALPIAWPRKTAQAISEIADLVDAGLRRQRVTIAGLEHPEVGDAVAGTYAGLTALERDGTDREVRARFDRLRSDLDTAADLTFTAFERLAADRRRLDRDVADLGGRVEALVADLARVTSEMTIATDTAAATRQRVEAVDRDALRRLERMIAGLEGRLQGQSGEVEGLKSDLAHALAGPLARRAPREAEEGPVEPHPPRSVRRSPRDAGRARWFALRRPRAPHAGDGDELRRLVLSTGLFDPAWYGDRYRDAVRTGGDALEYYLSVGLERNHSPGPLFDAAWYLDANPDVREAGLPALIHYARSGMAEGRRGTAEPAAPRSRHIEVQNDP